MANSYRIAAFDPRDHDYREINFSGKELPNAQFEGKDLREMQFQDAELLGAVFTDADLRGVNLIGANLSTADLGGADLSEAQLQGANLSMADVENAKSLAGAKVNARTCWPKGFLEGKTVADLRSGLVAVKTFVDGENVESLGHEDGECLADDG